VSRSKGQLARRVQPVPRGQLERTRQFPVLKGRLESKDRRDQQDQWGRLDRREIPEVQALKVQPDHKAQPGYKAQQGKPDQRGHRGSKESQGSRVSKGHQDRRGQPDPKAIPVLLERQGQPVRTEPMGTSLRRVHSSRA
jgi:hypothetical protein